MENVTIVEGRVNEIEFEMNLSGVNKKEPAVRFVIENKSMNYTMIAKHGDGDNWAVSIPVIPNLKNKSYPFRLEVIVDGYYFEPFRGTVDIVAEPVVKTANVGASHPAEPVVKGVSVKGEEEKKAKPKRKPAKKKVVKQKPIKEELPQLEEPVVEEPIMDEPPIEEIVEDPEEDFKNMADMWLSRDKPVVTEKDKTVKNIINDLATRPNVTETVCPAPMLDNIKDDEKVEQDSALLEKDIKVRAILNATKF